MSNSRQNLDHLEPEVRGYSVTHPPGAVALPVATGWGQLLYTAAGAMTVSVATGSWIIPHERALWIPDSERATVTNRSRVAVRCLYLAPTLTSTLAMAGGPGAWPGSLPDRARALTMSRFCRELLLHIVLCCPLDVQDAVHPALLIVLVNELSALPDAPLWLPRPTDPQAAHFAAVAAGEPAASSDDLARRVGSSRRTLERVFAAQTGLSLGAWRRRAGILDSLDLLASGTTVTHAALAAGYTTPSAYVAAFKRELGVAPRQFIRQQFLGQ
jgi:AraC-like DNA-binding protein